MEKQPAPLKPEDLKIAAKHLIDSSEHFVLWAEHSVISPEGVLAHPTFVGLLSPQSRARALLGVSHVLGGARGS